MPVGPRVASPFDPVISECFLALFVEQSIAENDWFIDWIIFIDFYFQLCALAQWGLLPYFHLLVLLDRRIFAANAARGICLDPWFSQQRSRWILVFASVLCKGSRILFESIYQINKINLSNPLPYFRIAEFSAQPLVALTAQRHKADLQFQSLRQASGRTWYRVRFCARHFWHKCRYRSRARLTRYCYLKNR